MRAFHFTFILFVWFVFPCFSEPDVPASDWAINAVLQLVEKSPLQREPRVEATRLGRVKSGAQVIFLGERKNGYAMVEVPLRDGRRVAGWIAQTDLRAVPKEKRRQRRRRRSLSVPEDEAALLARKPRYFYGFGAGLSTAFILNDGAVDRYSGLGYLLGGNVGTYLSKEVTLRLEVNYLLLNGTNTADALSLKFGFIEAGLVGAVVIDERLELFGGLHYSRGISINDLPIEAASQVATASDLSYVWAQGGAGYFVPLGEVVSLVFRLRYSVALTNTPLVFHAIVGSAGLQFTI